MEWLLSAINPGNNFQISRVDMLKLWLLSKRPELIGGHWNFMALPIQLSTKNFSLVIIRKNLKVASS
jgi:hypothetical protein